MKDNLTVIHGAAKPDAMAELLRKAESEMPEFHKLMAFEAKRKRVAFEAYVTAGFTPEQALTLIK